MSLTASGEWLLPVWREIGGGGPCQNVSRATKKLHGVAAVLISSDQVSPPVPPGLQSMHACMHANIKVATKQDVLPKYAQSHQAVA